MDKYQGLAETLRNRPVSVSALELAPPNVLCLLVCGDLRAIAFVCQLAGPIRRGPPLIVPFQCRRPLDETRRASRAPRPTQFEVDDLDRLLSLSTLPG
jgi:hypothetical protein